MWSAHYSDLVIMARRSGGNFRDRIQDVESIEIEDWVNPWNFYFLFMQNEEIYLEWCRKNNILARTIPCQIENCGGEMFLKSNKTRTGGGNFRCDKDKDHKKAIRSLSFFENSNLTIPDIMVFIKSYLDGSSLLQCSLFSGMTYKSTAVNWASFVRELFKEYFHRHIRCRKLSGEIEIDESLFGRRVKHNRGNPNKGVKIWVFGMVERSSNTIILYPVQDRSAETMLPLIVRHVEPGSTIYSDGWSAYCELNNLGFMHFTVVHKYAFKKTYRNVETGDIVSVHTNKIEGAWKHAKDHFKKMSGTRLSQFEGHMAEIMWRSDSKGNLYREFFNILGEVYNLRQPYEYLYSTPLFDSWKGISCDPDVQKFDLIPCSDVETESCSSDVDSSEIDSSNDGRIRAISISSDSDIAIAPNREMSVQTVSQGQSSAEYLYNVLSCSSLSSENQSPSEHEIPETDLDTTLVSSPQPHCSKSHVPQKMVSKPRMSTKSVCCPKGFEETKSVPRRSSRKTENPYSRKAYVFVPDSDSDDDFV